MWGYNCDSLWLTAPVPECLYAYVLAIIYILPQGPLSVFITHRQVLWSTHFLLNKSTSSQQWCGCSICKFTLGTRIQHTSSVWHSCPTQETHSRCFTLFEILHRCKFFLYRWLSCWLLIDTNKRSFSHQNVKKEAEETKLKVVLDSGCICRGVHSISTSNKCN